MDLSQDVTARIEELLAELEELDPADLPEPAAELAALLGSVLDATEHS